MICGEFTPLVIVFMTGIVPRGIWIPKQVEGARRRVEERRRVARKVSGIETSWDTLIAGRALEESTGAERIRIGRFVAQSLDLYPAWWDQYFATIVPTALVERRARRRVEDITVDDLAIRRDGGVGSMNAEEVVWACEERGIDVLERGEKDLRGELEKWMRLGSGR